MKKAQRAAPQALVAWGTALRVLCAKILRQNRRFLMPLRRCLRGPEGAAQAGMSVPKRKNTVVSAATLSSFKRSMA